MPHTPFVPEQFALIANLERRLPNPAADAAPILHLDTGVAAAVANAVYDRNNKRYNNYANTTDMPFVIDVSELGHSHFPAPLFKDREKLPEDVGHGYRVHLPNAESDYDTWVINETFAFAFQRVLDREEYTQRVDGKLLLGLGACLTAGGGMAGLSGGVAAANTLGASGEVVAGIAIGGAAIAATTALGMYARDGFRRYVSNGEGGSINRRHMKATLGHLARQGADPVIYTT